MMCLLIQGPGPADYFLNDPSKKEVRPPHYRHKHYLCFSAPALPLPPVPPPPGPGHYEVSNKMAIGTGGRTLTSLFCVLRAFFFPFSEKSELSGAVFKSITSRGTAPETSDRLDPGPGYYNPIDELRRSYFYNVNGRWI